MTFEHYKILRYCCLQLVYIVPFLLLPIAFSRRKFYLRGIKYYPMLFSLLEITPIALLVYGISFVPLFSSWGKGAKGGLSPYIHSSQACTLSIMGFLLLAIFLVYLRPRLKSYLLMLGIPISCYLVYFSREQYLQIVRNTNEELISPYTVAMNPSLLVPEVWAVLSKLLFIITSLVIPYLMVKTLNHYVKFTVWFVLSVLIVQLFLVYPGYVPSAYIYSVIYHLLLGFSLYYAPIFRQSLKSVFRFYSYQGVQKNRLLCFVAFVLGINFCFVSYLEKHFQYADFGAKRMKFWEYSSEVDLVGLMTTEFTQCDSLSDLQEDAFDQVAELEFRSNITSFDEYFTHPNFSKTEFTLNEYNHQLDQFVLLCSKSSCLFHPYCQYMNDSLWQIRQLILLVEFRAKCSIFRRDSDKFLEDLNTLYSLTILNRIDDHETMDTRFTIMYRANGLAMRYLLYFRQYYENLGLLKNTLDSVGDRRCRLEPYDFPSYIRKSYRDYYLVGSNHWNIFDFTFSYQQKTIAEFDHLRLLTALFLYYHDYAEWPDDLSQLVPVYIDKVPLNPRTGKTYKYSYSDAGVSIETEVTDYPDYYDIKYEYPVGADIIPANVPWTPLDGDH